MPRYEYMNKETNESIWVRLPKKDYDQFLIDNPTLERAPRMPTIIENILNDVFYEDIQ